VELQGQSQPASKPWVDWLAGRIPDPVTRLRFLQMVAPAPELVEHRKSRLAQLMLAVVLPALAAVLALVQTGGYLRPVSKPLRHVTATRAHISVPANSVWLVDKSDSSEIYSNGLRIDDQFRVSNRPRSYLAFPLDGTKGVRRSEPIGIVFHATQSRQAPFEADQNRVLKRIGESLLEYVQRKRAYHFLVDRFGRVYRVVAETDSANHAGYSVWADDERLYINLNQSFLGVAIEAENRPGADDPELSPGQLRAVGMLTEMLRSVYKIPADHCVTHAQVSVNPSNMLVGYHTDWASGFPFAQLGLPNNYAHPLPAIWAYGFESSPEFSEWAGAPLGAGLQAGEAELAAAAESSGRSLRTYRKLLQNQYRTSLAEVRRANSSESDDSE
jgi:N-acetylmuramoyl-L-alanine amidase